MPEPETPARRGMAVADAKAMQVLVISPHYDDAVFSCGHWMSTQVLVAALKEVLQHNRPQRLVIPLGLFHEDHLLAHRAGVAAWAAGPRAELLVYEDSPYRHLDGVLQKRLHELTEAGAQLTPQPGHAPANGSLKHQAVCAYRSQVEALGPHAVARIEDAERLWAYRPPGVRMPLPFTTTSAAW